MYCGCGFSPSRHCKNTPPYRFTDLLDLSLKEFSLFVSCFFSEAVSGLVRAILLSVARGVTARHLTTRQQHGRAGEQLNSRILGRSLSRTFNRIQAVTSTHTRRKDRVPFVRFITAPSSKQCLLSSHPKSPHLPDIFRAVSRSVTFAASASIHHVAVAKALNFSPEPGSISESY